jgi:hypothetical protein
MHNFQYARISNAIETDDQLSFFDAFQEFFIITYVARGASSSYSSSS